MKESDRVFSIEFEISGYLVDVLVYYKVGGFCF